MNNLQQMRRDFEIPKPTELLSLTYQYMALHGKKGPVKDHFSYVYQDYRDALLWGQRDEDRHTPEMKEEMSKFSSSINAINVERFTFKEVAENTWPKRGSTPYTPQGLQAAIKRIIKKTKALSKPTATQKEHLKHLIELNDKRGSSSLYSLHEQQSIQLHISFEEHFLESDYAYKVQFQSEYMAEINRCCGLIRKYRETVD